MSSTCKKLNRDENLKTNQIWKSHKKFLINFWRKGKGKGHETMISAFYSYACSVIKLCFVFHSFNSEIAFFKSLTLSRGCSPSVIFNALCTFHMPKIGFTLQRHCFTFKNIIILASLSSLSFKIP